jgi:uncharacterized protein YkwD
MLRRLAMLLPCLLLVLAVLPFGAAMPAQAEGADAARYFPETGHNVSGAFLSYFTDHGGVRIFGYPISEQTDESGRTVQYFERSRFEYNPDGAGTDWEVQLGLLGCDAVAGREFPACPPVENTTERLYVPETQHSISGGFLSFWAENGGVPVFGLPISEEFEETSATDGQTYTVQYFERARFEYHPEFAGTEWEVELGHLGSEAAHSAGVDCSSTPPPSSDAPSAEIAALEGQMYELINQDRADAGVAPLRYDPLIASVARAHAQDMVDNGYHGHTGLDGSTPNDRMRRAGVVFEWGSENYWTYWASDDWHEGIRVINDEMMAEEWTPTSFNHHWNLIYTGYTRVGVGVVIDSRGVLWVVEDFADGD